MPQTVVPLYAEKDFDRVNASVLIAALNQHDFRKSLI